MSSHINLLDEFEGLANLFMCIVNVTSDRNYKNIAEGVMTLCRAKGLSTMVHDLEAENRNSVQRTTVQPQFSIDGNLAFEKANIPQLDQESDICTVNDKILYTGRKVSRAYLLVKRSFDFLSSLLLSIVLLIPLSGLAILVVAKDFGNPFYVQKRVGRYGKVLGVAKLRSMKLGADRLEDMLTPEQYEEYLREYKLSDDPRLIGYKNPGDSTKCFGGMIRKMSLDELPQIVWNICIKGDMSVVGPRPILEEELKKNYTEEEQKLLLSVKPGLTGYWQAYARNNATYETGERQRMELYYVQNQSIRLDIKILFATVGAVLKERGAK